QTATKAKLDVQFENVRKAVGTTPVDRSALADDVAEAQKFIQGTTEVPKVFKDILSKSEGGTTDEALLIGTARSLGYPSVDAMRVKIPPSAIDQLMTEARSRAASGDPSLRSTTKASYNDLQGYVSEIGRELSKGTLPGDIFQAYKELQGKLLDRMEKIADAKGVGAALKKARSDYRSYMETFFEP